MHRPEFYEPNPMVVAIDVSEAERLLGLRPAVSLDDLAARYGIVHAQQVGATRRVALMRPMKQPAGGPRQPVARPFRVGSVDSRLARSRRPGGSPPTKYGVYL